MPTSPEGQHQLKYSPHCGHYGNLLAVRCTPTPSPGRSKSLSGTVCRKECQLHLLAFQDREKRIREWGTKGDTLKQCNYGKRTMKRKLTDGRFVFGEELDELFAVFSDDE